MPNWTFNVGSFVTWFLPYPNASSIHNNRRQPPQDFPFTWEDPVECRFRQAPALRNLEPCQGALLAAHKAEWAGEVYTNAAVSVERKAVQRSLG